MFTHDQHRKTGYRLQVIQHQLDAVAVNIRNSTPTNSALYQSTLALCTLYNLEAGPVKVLRRELENEACKEYQGRGLVYFLNVQPGSTCPKLLQGVPTWLAAGYEKKRKKRDHYKGRGKPALDHSEIKAVSLFLNFIGNEITNIGKEILEHYGANHQGTKAALESVRAIQNLSFALAAIRPKEVTP
ncbi:MAG TPA: hypothetical protein ENJ30_07850 [Desulfobulbaceae bacterium]|nr:hypothetical protein [Desulfobulbaceae bacterium]